MQIDLIKFYFSYFNEFINWFLLIGKLILFGFKIDLSMKSPTSLSPSNNVVKSLTLISLSIRKFGTIFFSFDVPAKYKVLFSKVSLFTNIYRPFVVIWLWGWHMYDKLKLDLRLVGTKTISCGKQLRKSGKQKF